MSHKASNWLASLPASSIDAGAFRVLFHLCDAHNSSQAPELACFPSQAILRDKTGLSNGGLNNALNRLEKDGFLMRKRTKMTNGRWGRTYYILGCDVEMPQEPSPQYGDGTVSTLDGSPSPVCEQNRLHSTGEKPVKEPVKEPVNGRAKDLEIEKEFEIALWNEFPKHPNSVKQTALKAYKRLTKAERVRCIQGVGLFADRFEAEQTKEPMAERLRYVCHLSTFINQRRFDDEIAKQIGEHA